MKFYFISILFTRVNHMRFSYSYQGASAQLVSNEDPCMHPKGEKARPTREKSLVLVK